MLITGLILKNKYRILHTLGDRGVSGQTYLAENIMQAMHCAIKELEPPPCKPEVYQEICTRFRTEADYLSRLGGFNGQIPKYYEYFKASDSNNKEREYIVQEYINGQTLMEVMKASGRPMSELRVKEILLRLLPVISHIHETGFIHRDIKPGNIILRISNNIPVLIDYGAVKEYEITLTLKASAKTAFIGTPGYYDEDQLNGSPTVASDLYALGALAVYLLTNIAPQNINRKDSKLLWGAYVSGLSKDFFHLIDKAVEPRTSYPGQRFTSAQAMLNALNQVVLEEDLEEELTQLASRQIPSTSNQRFVKCRECGWYIHFDGVNCTNCGVYNVYCFTEDEVYLFMHSPGLYINYLKKIFLTRNNKAIAAIQLSKNDYDLINSSIPSYVREHTNILTTLPDYLAWDGSERPKSIPSKRPFRVSLGEYLEAHRKTVGYIGIVAWILLGLGIGIPGSIEILRENKISLCFSPIAVIIAVMIIIWTGSLVWVPLDSITHVTQQSREC